MVSRRFITHTNWLTLAIVALLLLSLLCLVPISIESGKNVNFSNSALHNLRSEVVSNQESSQHPDTSIIDDNRRIPLELIDNLIIVPGHSIMDIFHSKEEGKSLSDRWILLDYQKKSGLKDIISSHIEVGVKLAAKTENSLLLFSGGQTRISAGPVSEGLSYYLYSDNMNWWGHETVKERAFVEEFARDSFENLLFSICRFHQLTSSYPKMITVVGFDFKQYRFENLHLRAIFFPSKQFRYVGLTPVSPPFNHESAVAGEAIVVAEFEEDLHGCHSTVLQEKRSIRDPYKRYFNSYSASCPEIKGLLECQPHLYPNGSGLPWNQ